MRERVSGWLYLLGWIVVCRMPRRWAQWMFRQIADQLWRRQGPGVRQLEANLARVIGPDAPVMDLRRLSRDGMRSYLRYWLEVFRLPVIPPAEILGRMRAAGEEQTAFRHLAAGRGVIFALPHMGNWEHAGAWIVLRGVSGDRQAPGGLAHAAEGVRGRSRHRQAAPRWPATATRRVTAPRRHPSRLRILILSVRQYLEVSIECPVGRCCSPVPGRQRQPVPGRSRRRSRVVHRAPGNAKSGEPAGKLVRRATWPS